MKKVIVFGVIALFIFVGFQPAFAIESKFSADNTQEVEDCEPCNNECDVELVRIIPYHFRGVVLFFGCKIKNVGNYTCSGGIGFEVKAYLYRTNKLITTDSYIFNGELHEGEERSYTDSQHGVNFGATIFPRFYRLRFRAYPDDSNMVNNYLEAIYMVSGYSDFFQNYKLITTYRPGYNTNEI